MILYDFHLHSEFSSDSKTPAEEQIKAAIGHGAKGICFTDHMDYDYPCIEENGETFLFDEDDYWEKLLALREKYSDRLQVMIGVEIGLRNEPDLRPKMQEAYGRLINEYPFDFIIGSTHCLEHTDPFNEYYWQDKNPLEGLRNYFIACAENARDYEGYDTAGHYDYAVRYVPAGNDWKGVSSYDPMQFIDITDEYLKTLIHRGIALECNTAGLKYGLGFAHPHDIVLKRYLELGGELLTIGSDGHKPEHIFYDFEQTEEHLKALGYKYYTIYRAHKPEFIKL